MHSRDKNEYSDRDKWEDEICPMEMTINGTPSPVFT